jgi:Flp pilus assembly protein TadG
MNQLAAIVPRARRPTRVRRGRESGFTSVELAIIAPVLLVLIFSIVHIGMLFHTRNVVNDVASAALREAELAGSSASQAETIGYSLAKDYGSALTVKSVSVTRKNGRVTVVVTADGIPIVPFLPTLIVRTVSGPVERFVSENDRT